MENWILHHELSSITTVKIPLVQPPNANIQICRKAEPSRIWKHHPKRSTIHIPPHRHQFPDRTAQNYHIRKGPPRFPRTEEQRHPEAVEDQLRRVQRLGRGYCRRGCEGGRGGGCVVGRVAHHPVEDGPHGPEDPGGRA